MKPDPLDPPPNHLLNAECVSRKHHRFTSAGDPAELGKDQTSNSADVLPTKIVLDHRLQLGEGDPTLHLETAITHFLDGGDFVRVVFVSNLSDDFFENVLQRDDAGGPAVLIHHYRKVPRAALKLVKLPVE
jgi:hypothetical protein